VVVVGRREGSNVRAPLPKSFMSCLLHQSLFFDVKSVVSSDPSALVCCSCFLAYFAPLLLLVVLQLQKGMTSALKMHQG